MPESVAASKEAKNAGRGFLFIVGAKLFFIVSSYAIQLALPRLLGEVEFGLYATAMRVVSMINNVLIVSTVQSVSRFVSEREELGSSVVRYALRIQLIVAFVLGTALLFLAPTLSTALLDERLTQLFQIVAIVPFSYALYATFVGWFNGTQRFKHQASLDMGFSALRTTGIIGAALLGFGAAGALSGFAIASLCILTVAVIISGLPRRDPAYSSTLGSWLRFMGPLWLYHAALNTMMQLDQPLLKRAATLIAIDDGQGALAAADTASRYAAYYQAAQTFAFVPYQLILSITFVIFPLISKAVAEGERERAQEYIRSSLRVSFLFLIAISAPISAAAAGVVRVAYPEAYAISATPLSILVFGLAGFALFVISATIITSSGKPTLAFLCALAGMLVVVGLNLWLVPETALGPETLKHAAMSTSIGMISAWLLSVCFVWQRFRTYLAPLTVLRGVSAGAAAWWTTRFIGDTNFIETAAAGLGGVTVFVLLLVISGELRKTELVRVAKLFSRKN